MTLKINYLDRQKDLSKNMALFLGKDAKISDFKGIFDDKINQKVLNFLKNNKKTTDNKIFSLNLDFDQKLIIVFLVKKNDFFQSEKVGAKFYDYVKNNEVNDILILGSNFPSVIQNIKFHKILYFFSFLV